MEGAIELCARFASLPFRALNGGLPLRASPNAASPHFGNPRPLYGIVDYYKQEPTWKRDGALRFTPSAPLTKKMSWATVSKPIAFGAIIYPGLAT